MRSVAKILIVLACYLSSSALYASCDGIPIMTDPSVECSSRTDRASCQSLRGCNWTPEPAFIRICNKTDVTLALGVQYVRTAYNKIGEEGWWVVAQGKCQDFTAPNATSFSYFAKEHQGNRVWTAGGNVICYDAGFQRYDWARDISDNSCGFGGSFNAYQTLAVKDDDFIQTRIEGSGQVVNLPSGPSPQPAPSNPSTSGLKSVVAAWTQSGKYFVRHSETIEEAKSLAMLACEQSGEACSLAVWLGTDRLACFAILKGSNGTFLAYGLSFEGREDAINNGLANCQNSGQVCTVDYSICNNSF